MGRSRACQVKGKLLLSPFPLLESVLCTFLLCNLECAPNTVCVLSFALVKGNSKCLLHRVYKRMKGDGFFKELW